MDRLPAALTHRLGRVHHVAVVVRDLEDSLGFYRDILGLELETILPIPTGPRPDRVPAGRRIQDRTGQPTDDSTGVARFLEAKGEGFHHVCFEVAGPRRDAHPAGIDGRRADRHAHPARAPRARSRSSTRARATAFSSS